MLGPGDVFAGYTIERQLGRGGMGSVYLARHPRLPRSTALKLLNRELFADNEVRARFEREADLTARFDHPNIVTVFDRGVEADQMWISMQFIDGPDAASLDPRTLHPVEAVRIIGETAAALDYAHSKGVLHRDIKPANILLARESSGGNGHRVYLTDFGIARLRDDTTHLTQTGTFTATLAYASPEQLSSIALDERADQYSLACTLYWLLTGRAPFADTNPAAVIKGHLMSPPPPLSAIRPDLAAADPVFAKAMAKHPGDRFRSCGEFAAAAWQAITSPNAAVPVASSPPAGAPRSAKDPVRRRRVGVLAAFGGGILVAAVVATVAVIGFTQHATTDDTVATGQATTTTSSAPTSTQEARSTSTQTLPAEGTVLHNSFPQMVPVKGGEKTGYQNAACEFANDNQEVRYTDLPYLGNWMVNANCSDDTNSTGPGGQYIFYLYRSPDDVQAVLDGLISNTKATQSKNGKTYTTYTMPHIGGSGYTYMVTKFSEPDRYKMLMLSIFRTTEVTMSWWQSAPLN